MSETINAENFEKTLVEIKKLQTLGTLALEVSRDEFVKTNKLSDEAAKDLDEIISIAKGTGSVEAQLKITKRLVNKL